MKIYHLVIIALLLLASASSFGQKDAKTMPRSITDPIRAGDIAPDFSLKDENGETFTLSKIKKPVVLVFYRGYW